MDASHPSWVCGLKQDEELRIIRPRMSHPSWVCGLKQVEHDLIQSEQLVTPFVGVWIETHLVAQFLHIPEVTPFVGVWIETKLTSVNFMYTGSHPSWVCGLKQNILLSLCRYSSHTLRGCVD